MSFMTQLLYQQKSFWNVLLFFPENRASHFIQIAFYSQALGGKPSKRILPILTVCQFDFIYRLHVINYYLSRDTTFPTRLHVQLAKTRISTSSSKVIKLFSCSTQLSMKFVLLINLKILAFVNSFLLNITEHENFSANKYQNANYCWHFHIY